MLSQIYSKKTRMDTVEFIWKNGEFIKWEDCTTHVISHTLHYGGGAFEGIRCYQTERGTAVFRLKEHMERLHYSSKAIGMTLNYSVDDLCEATLSLLKKTRLAQGYIRPLAFYGTGQMGLRPGKASKELIIAAWPWGAYLPHETVDVKISSYIRIHPKSTIADAKICGHYVNSILSVLELNGTNYHEALLLDSEGYIAEGPGENFFIVKDETVYTPARGTILPGITRDTIFKLSEKYNYPVVEKKITPEEAFNADEAFFTGTAAEITPIQSIDDKQIGKGGVGPITAKFRDGYLDVVYGRDESFDRFLSYVK